MHKQLSRILIGFVAVVSSLSATAAQLTEQQQLYLDARSKLNKQQINQGPHNPR